MGRLLPPETPCLPALPPTATRNARPPRTPGRATLVAPATPKPARTDPCPSGRSSAASHRLAATHTPSTPTAQFHGLASVSDKSSGSVSVCRRPCALASGVAFAPPDITCTDVLLALGECGVGGLTRDGLGDYVRKHVHGAGSDTGSEAEWVVVS
jgi:hypothetical protein